MATYLHHHAPEGPATQHPQRHPHRQLVHHGADEEHKQQRRQASGTSTHEWEEDRAQHPFVDGDVPQLPVVAQRGCVPPVLRKHHAAPRDWLMRHIIQKGIGEKGIAGPAGVPPSATHNCASQTQLPPRLALAPHGLKLLTPRVRCKRRAHKLKMHIGVHFISADAATGLTNNNTLLMDSACLYSEHVGCVIRLCMNTATALTVLRCFETHPAADRQAALAAHPPCRTSCRQT